MSELTKRESSELTQQSQPSGLSIAPSITNQLLERAIESNAGIETLERLMALYERDQNRTAKAEFIAAVSQFQSICPRITKRKQGHNYKYAPLGDIREQIKGALKDCGLTYRWEVRSQSADMLEVACIVTHTSGHSEETAATSFVEPPNKMQSRTQMMGVATTYAQRYSLIGALGLSTADDDVDGRLPDEYKEKPAYLNFKTDRAGIQKSIDNGRPADDIIESLEKDYKVSDAVKDAITKMGVKNND